MQLNTPGQFKTIDNKTEITVKQKIESLNQFMPSKTAEQRGGIMAIINKWDRYKRAWMKALQILPRKKAIEGRVNVKITSKRIRLLDVENLYGGSKPIRDALQTIGWLWNDSPKWGTLEVVQERVKKGEEGTIIVLV